MVSEEPCDQVDQHHSLSTSSQTAAQWWNLNFTRQELRLTKYLSNHINNKFIILHKIKSGLMKLQITPVSYLYLVTPFNRFTSDVFIERYNKM